MNNAYFNVTDETAVWTFDEGQDVFFSLAKGIELKDQFPQVTTVVIPNTHYEYLYTDLVNFRRFTDQFDITRDSFYNGVGFTFRDLNKRTMRIEDLFVVMPQAYVKA